MGGSGLVSGPGNIVGQPDGRSDLELVAALNAGDTGAFDTLYHRHRDWVVNLAFRFTGDRDLALDVLQETFLYFVKKFPGFQLTANLRTFFYPAVRNLSLTARRKTERVQSSEADQERIESAPAADAPVAEGEALTLALAGMSESYREVVWLRFVDGLALAEIAEVLEIPVGTVKSRLHHALEALRRDERIRNLFEP